MNPLMMNALQPLRAAPKRVAPLPFLGAPVAVLRLSNKAQSQHWKQSVSAGGKPLPRSAQEAQTNPQT